MWEQIGGAVAGAGLSYLGARRARHQYDALANELRGFATPLPFNITSDFGSVTGGQDARLSLAPRLRALADQYYGASQNFIPSINPINMNIGEYQPFDVDASARERFNIMESILAPGRDKAIGNLESRLFSQGLLTSTPGYEARASMQSGIEGERLKNLLSAFGEARSMSEEVRARQGEERARFGLTLGAQQSNLESLEALQRLGLNLEQLPMGLLDASLRGTTGMASARAGIAGALGDLGPRPDPMGALLSSAGSSLMNRSLSSFGK